MSKLIILVGVPGSGKSTFAANYVANNLDALIVGRDKLRELLFGFTESTVQDYYKSEHYKAREDAVTQFQQSTILLALQTGRTVIVDDTNCNYDRLKSIADRYAEYTVTVQFFDTPLEECLRRNELRTRKVPTEAILKFYESFLTTKEKWNAKPAFTELDEKGFVFLDANKTPYFICMYCGNPWLFFWHPDNRWVTSRQVDQTTIWMAYENRLPDDQAALYHKLNARGY